MAFIAVTYKEVDYDIVVFPEAWAQCRSLLEPDAPVVCRVIRTDRGVHLSQVVRLDWMEKN